MMRAFLGLMLAAAAQTAATPPPQAHSVQQDFDSASLDATSGKCASAVTKFEALEKTGAIKPGSFAAAVVGVRKGSCLVRLDRFDEGEAAILSGLPAVEKAGENFQGDVAIARVSLGDAAQQRFDYAGAQQYYKAALPLLPEDLHVGVLGRLSHATTFDGDRAPLDYADQAIKLASAPVKPDKDVLAELHRLHARALLNQGKNAEAYAELKQSLELSGGLTQRSTLEQVSIRGDLATAAMLTGDKNKAREYLTYTGEGRLEKSPFGKAISMESPLCGEETGLRPEDFAVVEFNIGNDGSVTSAQTVYSRGTAAVAAAFAKAVRGWYWKPEDALAVPLFYRTATRVEVRCSNTSGGVPGLFTPLDDRFDQWQSKLTGVTKSTPDPVAAMRRVAEKGSAQGDAQTRLAALTWLTNGQRIARTERATMLEEALTLAARPGVPVEVLDFVRINKFFASLIENRPRISDKDREAALALADELGKAGDWLAADTVRLSVSSGTLGDSVKQGAPAMLQVAQDNNLPEHHALRQYAWLRLADAAAGAGDVAKAQEYFAKTGLTEQQCSLLGVTPAIKSWLHRDSDYPAEALEMGFEGWTQLEFDVTADGKAANARAIVAYPPQVFVQGATAATRTLRFESSYRPSEGVACRASKTVLGFRIGRN